MQDLTHPSSLSQVLVSNSLAGLSGSTAERIYCDNLNISVCPLTESSKKVTHPYKIKCVTLNIYIYSCICRQMLDIPFLNIQRQVCK